MEAGPQFVWNEMDDVEYDEGSFAKLHSQKGAREA